MKVLKEIKLKTKDELYQSLKQKKVFPFFRIYQKLIEYNVFNYYFYIIILFLEYLQLLYELLNINVDYIRMPSTNPLRSSSSYYFFRILQYIGISNFINKDHLNYDQFLIFYIIIFTLIILNFIVLVIYDIFFQGENSNKFSFVYIISGIFNLFNMKIFIIPFTYVLLESCKLLEYERTTKESSVSSNNSSSATINDFFYTENSNHYYFEKIFIRIFSAIAFILNYYTLINTSLLYNELNPIKSNICWAQSYPQIEMFNINLKIILVLFNVFRGKFFFAKSIFALLFNILRCYFRFLEWYYAWNVNKVTLVISDFAFLFFNFLTFAFEDNKHLDKLLIFLLISIVFGGVVYYLIENHHRRIITQNIFYFKGETEFCRLIMQVMNIMQHLSSEKKSAKDQIFFGFLETHSKYCQNEHCTSKMIKKLLYEEECKFSNEIDNFTISKADFLSYCKADKGDNFEMMQDAIKSHCEKAIYYLIKCIIDHGITILPKGKIQILPLLEAYVYIHIFNNKFFALFEIMKYYKADANYREKFFFFLSLSNTVKIMGDENNIKNSSNASINILTDFYFYHDHFVNSLRMFLEQSNEIFIKLVAMQPSSSEILNDSVSLGIRIKQLHSTYLKIMSINPYEINILRLYTFVIDKLYEMKALKKQNTLRLLQNIKYFLMNDKFKSSSYSNVKEKENVVGIKNYQENSDSGLLIISGLLDNLGEVLYANDLVTSILGYKKNEIVGFSINTIIPQPVAKFHNHFILSFYKNGKRRAVDRERNRFAVHQSGVLVNINLYVVMLPNLDFGILFIGLFKKSYTFRLNQKEKDDIVEQGDSFINKSKLVLYHKETKSDIHNNNNSNNVKKHKIKSQIKNTNGSLLSNGFPGKKNDTKSILREKRTPSVKSDTQRKKDRILSNRASIVNITPKPKSIQSSNLLFKTEETGIIITNKDLDILYTNIFTLVNFFCSKKPLPIGKINFKKLSRELITKFKSLKNGESVGITIDIQSFNSKFGKLLQDNLIDGGFTTLSFKEDITSNVNCISSPVKKKFSSHTIYRPTPKFVKASLEIQHYLIDSITEERDYYYLIAIQNNNQKDISASSNVSSDEKSSDFNLEGNSLLSDDDEDNGELFISQRNKEDNIFFSMKKIKDIKNKLNRKKGRFGEIEFFEKTKQKLLNDTYISNFTRAANISLYTLLIFILVWLVVSFVIELIELGSIRENLKIYVRNERFIQIISNSILEAFLLIRSQFFPLVNCRQLTPLLIKMMRIEKESIYNILKLSIRETSRFQDDDYRKFLFISQMEYHFISEQGEEITEMLSLEHGIKRLLFYLEFLKLFNATFNPECLFISSEKDYIKSKIYFIFSNFYDPFFKEVSNYSDIIIEVLEKDIHSKKNKLIIIYIISIVFCLVVSFLFIVTLINQEKRKKDYLKMLGEKPDEFYDEKGKIFTVFKKNMEILLREDHNMHKIKQLIDKDEEYKNDFLSGDAFLYRKCEDTIENKLLLSPSFGFTGSKTLNRHISDRGSVVNGIKGTRLVQSNNISNIIRASSKNFTKQSDASELSTLTQQKNDVKGNNSNEEDNLIDIDETLIQDIDKETEIVGDILRERNSSKSIISDKEENKGGLDGKEKDKSKINNKLSKFKPKDDRAKMIEMSHHSIFKTLHPATNPNLVDRKIGKKNDKKSIIHSLIPSENTHKDNKDDENSKVFPIKGEESFPLQIKDNSSDGSSESEFFSLNSYTHYRMPWRRSILTFLLTGIYLSSFFIFSIIYLLTYYNTIETIVDINVLICERDKAINNLIISANIKLMFNYSIYIEEKYSVNILAEEIQKIEEKYKNVLSQLRKGSDIYFTILGYESKELCDTFKGFDTNYNIIKCETFLAGNGMSFKMAEIVHYVYEVHLYMNEQRLNSNITSDVLERKFNDPIFIDFMIENLFFLRLFRTDISMTYEKEYNYILDYVTMIFHIKFSLYIVLIILCVILYQCCLMPKAIEIINNLTRAKLVF